MIKAVIMAGGEGTRLRPLTCNRAKPMVPVVNRPVIEHAIELLRAHGIKDIIISLFYLPENIQNYFGDGSDWDVSITYSVEESPLGTAGGVKKAIGDYDGTFIVMSGDGIVDFDISAILEFHKSKKSSFTIVLARVSKPTEYGIVITRDDGKIEKFLEKPSWSEVFSDTANTGMYVIDSKIIRKHVPEDVKFDFSMNLFPLLQKKGISLYGYVARGYWCDVGNLTTYSDVHRDILDGIAAIDIPGKKIAGDVWAGIDVDIHPEAEIKGPVVLGNFVKIKKGASISEFSTIGDNCIIEENASIKKSVILHNTVIGPKCEIRGAIIGKRCVFQENVAIYEGSVVSDDCVIGTAVIIPAGIRVWPDKAIEQGTRLTGDLIWGKTEKKTHFGPEGIIGSFNITITPEFASRLGSALGAYLGKNKKVIISRDTTSAARLIKRAFSAGLLSMGVNVYDMEIESIPVNRYSINFTNADMGFYVQISPLTGLQFIQIRIFNRQGFQISLEEEKKIENIFFRGDYPRKDAFETGRIIYPAHNIESYIDNTANYIDAKVIREKRWKIIADCFNGAASYVFPELLNYYGCETTVLRGQIKEFINDSEMKTEARKALNSLLQMTKINREIGVIIGPHAAHMTVVDEKGNTLNENDLLALLSLFYLKYCGAKTVNIPVTSSSTLENIIAGNGGKAARISSKFRGIDTFHGLFSKNGPEKYPHLEILYDPMISFMRILEFLSYEETSLCEMRESIPKSNLTSTTIRCNADEKAAIMRLLSTSAENKRVELVDGIRIIEDSAWILIMPAAINPVIPLYAEGEPSETRDAMLEAYTRTIKKHTSGVY
jgi:mannose-1-phosphate guanylyltransferase/phosphomannomutase